VLPRPLHVLLAGPPAAPHPVVHGARQRRCLPSRRRAAQHSHRPEKGSTRRSRRERFSDKRMNSASFCRFGNSCTPSSEP
jgi:hypothetical protein